MKRACCCIDFLPECYPSGGWVGLVFQETGETFGEAICSQHRKKKQQKSYRHRHTRSRMEKSALVFIVLLAGTFGAIADNATETATTSETTTGGGMAGSTPTSTPGLKSTASLAPTPPRPSSVSKKEEDKPKDKVEMGCPPLGLESLRVDDTQIQASSFQRFGLGPHRGRLNIQSGIEDGDLYDGAWCADYKDRHQWLEVDALHLTRFTGVILQGRNTIWRRDWVTSYKVQLSNDSISWKSSMNATQEAIFEGNGDGESPVLALLPVPVVARYIRINPQSWYPDGDICLRAEILGCRLDEPQESISSAQEGRSKDNLDFRHHNYQEMRKVNVHNQLLGFHAWKTSNLTRSPSLRKADEVGGGGVSRHHAHLHHREKLHGPQALRDGDVGSSREARTG
uniref:F5/8 type C domain-containing protein n=1 Tax=Hippocampus comes TaxID=109280 RepID=A0A3Q3DXV1_HIPCM